MGEEPGGFWHVRSDFVVATPTELVEQFWVDDELNRKRSLTTFQDELALVDRGLAIYMEALQGAFKERSRWKTHHRASVAMLVHALNSFLAWRYLLMHGYLTEARLFARSIHESLSQALAFITNESLSDKFFDGRQMQPKEIRRILSSTFRETLEDRQAVLKQFSTSYRRLSASAHPTLHSFSLRTAAQEQGVEGLRKSVPEDVVFGGLLSDALGHVAWLVLAQDIANALATVGFVLSDDTGGWETRYRAYREAVETVWVDE